MNTNKHICHIVFGESPSNNIRRDSGEDNHEDIFKEIFKHIGFCDGNYAKRTFNSEAEKRAYIAGLEDCLGWLDFCILEDYYEESDIDKFEKMYEDWKDEKES